MKVGILTFHRAFNYGAVLQCYALQEFLKSCGHDVQIIDYQNRYLLRCYQLFDRKKYLCKNPFTMIKKTIKELLSLPKRIRVKRAYDHFLLTHFSMVACDANTLESFDCIVVGSDQVWNVKLTGGFDHYYWGSFRTNHIKKIISYAASVEELWDRHLDSTACRLLENFDAISVRESNLKNVLSDLVPDREVHVSVDPTLLMDETIWDAVAEAPKIKEKYVFLYQVRNSNFGVELAQRIANKLGLKLICMSANARGLNSKECVGASPGQFLGFIKNAEYVICSSFHGTVFSLLFQKKFYSLKLNDGRDSRVQSLMESVGALDQFVDAMPRDFLMKAKDYGDMMKKISAESKNYLRDEV